MKFVLCHALLAWRSCSRCRVPRSPYGWWACSGSRQAGLRRGHVARAPVPLCIPQARCPVAWVSCRRYAGRRQGASGTGRTPVVGRSAPGRLRWTRPLWPRARQPFCTRYCCYYWWFQWNRCCSHGRRLRWWGRHWSCCWLASMTRLGWSKACRAGIKRLRPVSSSEKAPAELPIQPYFFKFFTFSLILFSFSYAPICSARSPFPALFHAVLLIRQGKLASSSWTGRFTMKRTATQRMH